jgi:site-specific DNA-methyltransferase (adenine-specific)
MSPYYDEGGIAIYHGDVLDVLADLETPVDAVITDPPYASGTRNETQRGSSGAMVRSGRFGLKPIMNDQMTTTGFVWLMRHVAMECYPLMPDGASYLSFIDWRQWPNLVAVLETVNYRVQGMIVWDKGHFGMGNGFRAQHELICHASKGKPAIHNRSTGNVFQFPRQKPIDHPSPKPEGLMARLIEVVTVSGDAVLDPFMGAGTTLRVAKNLGRRAIGIEMEERYCEIAAERLQQGTLEGVA